MDIVLTYGLKHIQFKLLMHNAKNTNAEYRIKLLSLPNAYSNYI